MGFVGDRKRFFLLMGLSQGLFIRGGFLRRGERDKRKILIEAKIFSPETPFPFLFLWRGFSPRRGGPRWQDRDTRVTKGHSGHCFYEEGKLNESFFS